MEELIPIRHKRDLRVVAITASQIPGIAGRRFPKEMLQCPERYPDDIPILPESELKQLIEREGVQLCDLAYSDIANEKISRLASLILSSGSGFTILAPQQTWLVSSKPVIAVVATRTGCGKSQTTRWVSNYLRFARGLRVAIIRHPMPYGDLMRQRCQRFERYEDLDRAECTIEEREEYEQHLRNGSVVWAGVDYELILRQAEKEADVLIWDAGNNDTPFIKPDLTLCVADALRPGAEHAYIHGSLNVRMADLLLINKVNSASSEDVRKCEAALRELNPTAPVILCDSVLEPETDPGMNAEALIRGKRVLCIEDGPTLTHGGLSVGAAWHLSKLLGCRGILDCAPFAVGTIRKAYEHYPHLHHGALPAMGYSAENIKDLAATIAACSRHVDTIVIGTPVDLRRIPAFAFTKPVVRVLYALRPRRADEAKLLSALNKVCAGCERAGQRREPADQTETLQPPAMRPAQQQQPQLMQQQPRAQRTEQPAKVEYRTQQVHLEQQQQQQQHLQQPTASAPREPAETRGQAKQQQTQWQGQEGAKQQQVGLCRQPEQYRTGN